MRVGKTERAREEKTSGIAGWDSEWANAHRSQTVIKLRDITVYTYSKYVLVSRKMEVE